jgi:hypothetical protein
MVDQEAVQRAEKLRKAANKSAIEASQMAMDAVSVKKAAEAATKTISEVMLPHWRILLNS